MGNLFSGYVGLYVRREESDWDLTRGAATVGSAESTTGSAGGDKRPPPDDSSNASVMDQGEGSHLKQCKRTGDNVRTLDSKHQKLDQAPGPSSTYGSTQNTDHVGKPIHEVKCSNLVVQEKREEIDKFASSRNRGFDGSDEDHDMTFSQLYSSTCASGSHDRACIVGSAVKHIDSLPGHILVQAFGHLSVSELLHKVYLVSKYWYDLAHDPDLWRVVNLRGQTKVNDTVLQKVVSYSESVLSVDISDARSVSEDGVEALAKQCTGLQRLKLVRCMQLKEPAFVALGHHCPMLSYLYLNSCFAVSDKALQTIAAGCPKMKVLNINQCSKVSNEGIQSLGRGCPDLQELYIDQCKQVGDQGLLAIIEGCPKLTKLSAMSCVFSSYGITHLTKLPHLKHVELHDVLGVRDDCIIEVVRSCKDIEMLNLALCTQITDRCVDFIARRAPKLKSLYLASCDLTNQALMSLGAHSTTVEVVDVGWCPKITDEGAVSISEKCSSLRTLALIRCDRVTIQTMDYLVEKFPHIHYSTFWLDCRRLMNQAQRMGYTPPGGQLATDPTAPSLKPPAS